MIERRKRVLKPGGGKSAYVKSTGSLIIPAGTTNERPLANDRIAGAIRFNSTQQQFEGYNGNDFVSLGGVRDVDQDTYILTESSPNADEDTFEFFAEGTNNLAIDKERIILRNSKLVDVPGTLVLTGTTAGQDPVDVQITATPSNTSIFKVRAKKDIEITGGLRLRSVPTQGAIASIGAITSVAGNYGASQTYTGVASIGSIEGTGATFDVVTDGSGNITGVTINAAGKEYEVNEVVKITGNLVGGSTPDHDVTFPVATLASTTTPYSRTDVLLQDYITRLDAKAFISLDANASECKWKINRGWSGGTESYLTVFDSTADFVELDDCRVEGGQMTSFASNASITAFDKTAYKGAKTLITIESDDGKVQMFEVTAVCSAAGTVAHATVTNSITSDNDLMDATVSVAANNVNISLNKSSAATSSTSFTGRYTTTKVKV